jgi:PPM family protein phosphatase
MPAWQYLDYPLKGDDAGALFELDNAACAALADGVGSYSGGGLAARAVIELVKRGFSSAEPDFERMFRDCRDLLADSKEEVRLGTTLTVLSVVGEKVMFGHVGDCRIYHLRGEGLKTITNDQTELAYLLSKGVLNKYEAKNYKRSNVLMSVLAPDKEYALQTGAFSVAPRDRIILCSDGFYNLISKRDLRDLSVAHPDFETFVEGLNAVLRGTSLDDDASAALIEV